MARPIFSPPGSLDIRAAEIASYTHQDKLGRVVDGEGSSAGGGFATAHDWSSELVNLRAGYLLTPAWSFNVRWNNVFDRDYQLARGYNTARSNVFVSVDYSAP